MLSRRCLLNNEITPKLFGFLQPQYNSNHRDLNAKAAWQMGYTGKGVVVSILDDGIEKNHPDLMQNYVSIVAE